MACIMGLQFVREKERHTNLFVYTWCSQKDAYTGDIGRLGVGAGWSGDGSRQETFHSIAFYVIQILNYGNLLSSQKNSFLKHRERRLVPNAPSLVDVIN